MYTTYLSKLNTEIRCYKYHGITLTIRKTAKQGSFSRENREKCQTSASMALSIIELRIFRAINTWRRMEK